MRNRFLLAMGLIHVLTGWGVGEGRTDWPHSGPMPDESVKVRPHRYDSIAKGTKSYRPIEPMPWGDVNKRVAPPGSLPGAPPKQKQ